MNEYKVFYDLQLPGVYAHIERIMKPDTNGVSEFVLVTKINELLHELIELNLDIFDLMQDGSIITVKYNIEAQYVNPDDYSSDEILAYRLGGFRKYPSDFILKDPISIVLSRTQHQMYEELVKLVGKLDFSTGISEYVYKKEHFVGEYSDLWTKNGVDWCRRDDQLHNKYLIKKTYIGSSVNGIRTIGYNYKETFNQSIDKKIVEFYRSKKCVMLGVMGFSENTKIEIDHKDGRKEDYRVSNKESQKLEDFQPLSKAANDVKRQICKHCKVTNHRWDATNIKGNPYPFYEGDENYTEELGCVGCYQYDPVEYRKTSVKRISKEASEHTADYIMKKLYPEDK